MEGMWNREGVFMRGEVAGDSMFTRGGERDWERERKGGKGTAQLVHSCSHKVCARNL